MGEIRMNVSWQPVVWVDVLGSLSVEPVNNGLRDDLSVLPFPGQSGVVATGIMKAHDAATAAGTMSRSG